VFIFVLAAFWRNKVEYITLTDSQQHSLHENYHRYDKSAIIVLTHVTNFASTMTPVVSLSSRWTKCKALIFPDLSTLRASGSRSLPMLWCIPGPPKHHQNKLQSTIWVQLLVLDLLTSFTSTYWIFWKIMNYERSHYRWQWNAKKWHCRQL